MRGNLQLLLLSPAQSLANMASTTVRVSRLLSLPPIAFEMPLTSDPELTVTISPPLAHTGPGPVFVRLISYDLREGQVGPRLCQNRHRARSTVGAPSPPPASELTPAPSPVSRSTSSRRSEAQAGHPRPVTHHLLLPLPPGQQGAQRLHQVRGPQEPGAAAAPPAGTPQQGPGGAHPWRRLRGPDFQVP